MNVISFTTNRRDGNARKPGVLACILSRNRLAKVAACAEQVHGARILCVTRLRRSKTYRNVDGLLTRDPGLPLAIFTADCVPVFLTASTRGVVGILHAGWRGVHRRILAQALRMLRRWRILPSEVKVWTGPAIGPCCFEVGWDVARHFPASRRRRGMRWTVDLSGELGRQARRLGAGFQRQNPIKGCTMHHRRYFSYRRNQTEERQVSIIARME